jgi:hypothetical protein
VRQSYALCVHGYGTAGIGWPTPWVKIKINFNGGGQECPPYTFFGVPLDK